MDSNGQEASDSSYSPAISADGRYVTFHSPARNLVISDTNELPDVFVHDRETGVTERVSVGPGGAEGNGSSSFADISADGRYVAFDSSATNLIPGGTQGAEVFVHVRQTGQTELVSRSSTGAHGNNWSSSPSISADGRYVAFHSLATNLVDDDTNNANDVFVRDRTLGTTERVSLTSTGQEGNGDSRGAAISADGRYVVFTSYASNLAPGDFNGTADIFLHDRLSGITEAISVNQYGQIGNQISGAPFVSADGRYVLFGSRASNLVSGDTNNANDVFVRDRLRGLTWRVSVNAAGQEGNGDSGGAALVADALIISFHSLASNLVLDDTNNTEDVFVRLWQIHESYVPFLAKP